MRASGGLAAGSGLVVLGALGVAAIAWAPLWTPPADADAASRHAYMVGIFEDPSARNPWARNGPNNGTFPNVDEYDPRRNVWRALTNIPTSRHGSGVAVTKGKDGVERIYVSCGGPRQGNSKTDANEAFAY